MPVLRDSRLSATFINEAARIYFLLACILVLWAMRRISCKKKRMAIYFHFPHLFRIMDIIVFAGQLAAANIDPSHFIGSIEGLSYFKRDILLHEDDYFYYFASFDYVVIDIAMFLFYKGLSEHLAEEKNASSLTAAAVVIPLLRCLRSQLAGRAYL